MKNTRVKVISFIILFNLGAAHAKNIDFNTDLMDALDKEAVEEGEFNQAGYVPPGSYSMQVYINGVAIGERTIEYLHVAQGISKPCINLSLLKEMGIKKKFLDKVIDTHNSKDICYSIESLRGILIDGDIAQFRLTISIPQEYRDYNTQSWDPPSTWSDGINGVILDYGLNVNQGFQDHGNSTSFSSYGVAGLNTGPWRTRAEWNGNYQKSARDNTIEQQSDFKINRIYSYRALPELGAKLVLGQTSLVSSVFDSFNFTGGFLATDDSMLPPNLRGYAPEVVGIAKTNAKVVISQHGQILYETQVASGPFRISELSSSISGTLDVKVEEQDGTVQAFQVNTASIPYLARPGSFRYKLGAGKASLYDQSSSSGPVFGSGEFSYGVSNGWSLFGGGLVSDGYGALNLGVGEDLIDFGAISFDVTQSYAKLPHDINKSGRSYRINYSKSFTDYDSQVTFAGYRFTEQDYMTMNGFLAARTEPSTYLGGSKEMYSVVFSKKFNEINMGAYLDLSHQSYWYQPDNSRISLSLTHNFDFLDWHDLSVSLTAYKDRSSERVNNGAYLAFSMPLGSKGNISYSASSLNGAVSQNMTYGTQIDDRSNYSLSTSISPQNKSISGFYSRQGEIVNSTLTMDHQSDSTSFGLSLNGGLTATSEGVVLHRSNNMGGSRIMVDTDGIADIAVVGSGLSVTSNKYGKAVISDVSNYYRQSTSIDYNKLHDNIEPLGTPVQAGTLTEGSIGYYHYAFITGEKRLVKLNRKSGKVAPFAARVFNKNNQQIGMVGDDGIAYLSGLHNKDTVEVRWGDKSRCQVKMPMILSQQENILELSCN